LIDTHADLQWQDFRDRQRVIEQQSLVGLRGIVSISHDVEANREAVQIVD
jgi:hypothetical protein